MTNTAHEVRLTKWIRAPRDKVFAAWLDAEIMRRWFVPEGLTITSSDVDPRVGGQFRVTMQGAPGSFTAFGTYREIVPGEKLVFTHQWVEDDPRETLVSVGFADKDGGTEVSLTHSGLPSEESSKGHEDGWRSTLDNFARYFL